MPTPDPMMNSLAPLERCALVRVRAGISQARQRGATSERPRSTRARLSKMASVPDRGRSLFEPAADAHGGDAPRKAGVVVGLDCEAAQRCRPERRLELA